MDSMGYLFHELFNIFFGDSNDEQTSNTVDASASHSHQNSPSESPDGEYLNKVELKCATINAMRKYNNNVRIDFNEDGGEYILHIRSQIGASIRTTEQMREDYLCPTDPESVDPHNTCDCYFCTAPEITDADYIEFIKQEYEETKSED
jgi:hypothetical protein